MSLLFYSSLILLSYPAIRPARAGADSLASSRKATSLIRQFDMYTPIISMTSNAQPQDVDSYLQSGMNDVLAKPFTKHGLFGILDKHLIHLKAIQMSAEIPRSLGLPPLSDQGIMEAVMNGNLWNNDTSNPLSSMGWSDDTYQLVFQVCSPSSSS